MWTCSSFTCGPQQSTVSPEPVIILKALHHHWVTVTETAGWGRRAQSSAGDSTETHGSGGFLYFPDLRSSSSSSREWTLADRAPGGTPGCVMFLMPPPFPLGLLLLDLEPAHPLLLMLAVHGASRGQSWTRRRTQRAAE